MSYSLLRQFWKLLILMRIAKPISPVYLFLTLTRYALYFAVPFVFGNNGFKTRGTKINNTKQKY